ncbi:hypothetical protein OG562_34440 [Streptomyces sp. NBC_01275]|uniref:hypothetical protein n=1 Tax=Streptomyces sp. NBC_01275 TaxID=2903807 RepID=UPI0022531B10|nr:hypothetical protein [Streptomyces sp. NBC_01275]MCX4765988.1 hypothetical protein [Streptomyces sp. NBC_01275]
MWQVVCTKAGRRGRAPTGKKELLLDDQAATKLRQGASGQSHHVLYARGSYRALGDIGHDNTAPR